jgi:hypothetical protein
MAELGPFKLFFDSDGNPVTVDSSGNPLTQNSDITDALTNASTTAQPVTDLWIFAYGWNNDINDGTRRYDEWHTNMLAEAQRLQAQNLLDPNYQPLFVEIFWPSKAWVDDAAQPVVNMPTIPRADAIEPLPTPVLDLVNRESFIDNYRLAMDPEGVRGDQYDADFGRIYDLMHPSQLPTSDEINEFVQTLYKYKIQDPQSDPTEMNEMINVPVTRVEKRLIEKKPLIPPQIKVGLTIDKVLLLQQNSAAIVVDNLLDFFRLFTFWTMKARAAVVGQTGVKPLLEDLAQVNNTLNADNLPRVRIHLFSHSFGAKLFAAAVNAVQQPLEPSVNTFVLLLGAFSQFSFSSDIPVQPGTAGSYASVVKDGRVANPLVVIYSQHDLANKLFYPLAMKFSLDPIFILPILPGDSTPAPVEPIVSTDKFGSIGADGTQGLGAARQRDMDMQGLGFAYKWDDMNLQGVYCLSVDGGNFIKRGNFPEGAHNDLNHPEIFHLALAMSLR